jgi:hypothetical protein
MAGSADNSHPQSLFQAPVEEVVGKIVASIRRRRPQVILCDNEFGGYGHPDHIKLHDAAVQAFSAAADPSQYPEAGEPWTPQRLYFTAFTPGLLKLLVRLMPLLGRDPRKFGRNGDIDLVQVVSWETPVHARVEGVIPEEDPAPEKSVIIIRGQARQRLAKIAYQRILMESAFHGREVIVNDHADTSSLSMNWRMGREVRYR